MKQAAVRSLSCEVVPGKEGQIYFGDSARGHILSITFFLKDAQARGFHRWYSFMLFMKDKHLLLNSWSFFEKHICQMVDLLQKNATQVYFAEQSVRSQRALRLNGLDQKHSPARSLVKLTNNPKVFVQLHIWFTWLLLTGAKRLEEQVPTRCLRTNFLKRSAEVLNISNGVELTDQNDWIGHFRKLRRNLGTYNFRKTLFSALIGRQIIVRGPKTLVQLIINLFRLILPRNKFRCIDYSATYKGPDVCNILGLDLIAAVPKSCETVFRLDIVPVRGESGNYVDDGNDIYVDCDFVIKNDSDLPPKLPSLVAKIDKALSDENLSSRVVLLHITSLVEQWHHVSCVVREVKKKLNDTNWPDIMQLLGIHEQDEILLRFWASES